MHLTLIRHGQSRNNSLPESQREEDPPLTSVGHRQVAALGRWAIDQKIDVLLTSGFLRALQSAEAIRQSRPCPSKVWCELHEVGGCYRGYLPGQQQGAPGMNRHQIAEQFGGFEIDPRIGDDGWWACRPYESIDQATQRAQRMLQQMIEQFGNSPQSIVAVIHADLIVCMIQILMGDRFARRQIGPIRNASVTRFTLTQLDDARLDMFNAVTHLDSELVT